jgi:hypothetical protein
LISPPKDPLLSDAIDKKLRSEVDLNNPAMLSKEADHFIAHVPLKASA